MGARRGTAVRAGLPATTVNGMTREYVALAAWDRPTAAREFIPASHRVLPMLRVYLPFLGLAGEAVRWSQHVSIHDHPASLDWFEATAPIAANDPHIRDLVSCMGELDQTTATALTDAIGDVTLRCLRWVGYGEVESESPVRVFGEEFLEAELAPGDVAAGRRVPEFAWDPDGRLAWGCRLYPDSLIVAAELPIFQRLHEDPRLDTVSVRADRDILPGSAGD